MTKEGAEAFKLGANSISDDISIKFTFIVSP